MSITSDGTGYNSNANLLLFPGWCPSNGIIASKLPDQTHITTTCTLSGTVSEFLNYLLNVNLHVVRITVTTTDTANFVGTNKMTIGSIDGDGRVRDVADIMFNDYKVNNGTSVNDTLVIDDQKFITGGNFFMILTSLKLSTTMTFKFEYDSTSKATLLTAN